MKKDAIPDELVWNLIAQYKNLTMFLRFRKRHSGPDLYDLSDTELILNYGETHDHEVIAVLFTRYTHLVYGVCLKYMDDKDDAKDAVMEIFEDLPDLIVKHEIRNFKSWLHSVTRNHCLMILRKARPLTVVQDIPDEDISEDFMEFPGFGHQEEETAGHSPGELVEALKSLKGPQRQCIELVYLEGKSYQEVCEVTGYTYHEVKSHVQNGKRNLRIRLEELDGRKY
jgi:RNA polymerase sigma-70 factor (ECF subfamily)